MSRRVLITGGRGYVAGRLAQSLAASGWAPRIGTRRPDLDDHSTPLPVDRVQTDYTAPDSLRSACRGCEAVLHLAAPDEIESASDPEKAFVANAVYTARLVEAAVAAGGRRFIRLSTAHVYGRLEGSIDEETCPRPAHPYGIAHRAAEDWVLAAQATRRISGVVVRLSNGFGAPVRPVTSRWKLLVNDLCRQAVEAGTLTLRSDGGEWRNFLPLTDVERLAAHLLDLPDVAVGDGLFNAGGRHSTRVIDMATLVAQRGERVLHRSLPITTAPPSGLEYPRLDYRIDRLLATGFEPVEDVEAEIDRTLRACVEWFGGHQRVAP